MHPVDEGTDWPTFRHLFASTRDWQPGEFDPSVRMIANELAYDVLIVAPDWVLYPHEGGMDVIVESREARQLHQARYSGWLPV